MPQPEHLDKAKERRLARSSKRYRLLDLWIGVPLLVLTAIARKKRPLPTAPQRIGVISPTAIGDLILESGILLHLRRTYPRATIHLFHGVNNAGAVCLLPVDLQAHKCDFKDIPATLSVIKQARLDILADLTPWPRLTALYAALSGASTVGFCSERQHRHYAFDVVVPHLRTRHEVENLRSMAEVFGPCPQYEVVVRSDVAQPSLRLPYERLVLCHITPGGTRAEDKSWPVTYWAELANRLAADGFCIGFTGTQSDAAGAQAVISATGLPANTVVSLCGKMSLAELASALKSARLLVTIDTGVLHLASALHVPTVALHGPTHSQRWGARSPVTISINAPHSEAGFIHLGFEKTRNGSDVMRSLSVDMVHNAVKSVLSPRKMVAL